MFHPVGHPLERGWVGRVDGDRVVQLAAQTLQSFFTGGGTAREHAEYPLAEVVLLAPGAAPAVDPDLRRRRTSSRSPIPAAIAAPAREIVPDGRSALAVAPRIAAVIGAGGEIGGFTILAEWREPVGVAPPKDRDFALGLGPVAVTTAIAAGPALDGFDWAAAVALADGGHRPLPGRHPRCAPRPSARRRTRRRVGGSRSTGSGRWSGASLRDGARGRLGRDRHRA